MLVIMQRTFNIMNVQQLQDFEKNFKVIETKEINNERYIKFEEK